MGTKCSGRSKTTKSQHLIPDGWFYEVNLIYSHKTSTKKAWINCIEWISRHYFEFLYFKGKLYNNKLFRIPCFYPKIMYGNPVWTAWAQKLSVKTNIRRNQNMRSMKEKFSYLSPGILKLSIWVNE